MKKGEQTVDISTLTSFFSDPIDYLLETKIKSSLYFRNIPDFNIVLFEINRFSFLPNYLNEISSKLNKSISQVQKEIKRVEISLRPKILQDLVSNLRLKFQEAQNEFLIKNFSLNVNHINKPFYGRVIDEVIEIKSNINIGLLEDFRKDYEFNLREIESPIRIQFEGCLDKLLFLSKEFQAQLIKASLAGERLDRGIMFNEFEVQSKCLEILLELLKSNSNPFVDSSTTFSQIKDAFTLKIPINPIKWLGRAEDLHYLIDKLLDEGLIKFYGKGKWPIVAQLFCNADGEYWSVSTFSGNTRPYRVLELDGIVNEVIQCKNQ